VVPGITAASGCSAYAGIPLTHRDLVNSCRFITGHLQRDGDLSLPWSSLADGRQTLVFYMGLSNLGVIAERLIEAGLAADTPAALICNGTRPDQHVVRGVLRQLPSLARASSACSMRSRRTKWSIGSPRNSWISRRASTPLKRSHAAARWWHETPGAGPVVMARRGPCRRYDCAS
jgi:precorrin-3B methylase